MDIITNKDAINLLESNRIERLIDNTLLKPEATEKEIEEFVMNSLPYNFYSLCVSPCWVKFVKELIKNSSQLTTVVGFPNGTNTTSVKLFETDEAITNGATEIDMVINIGFLKSKKYEEIENEIRVIKSICNNLILKVIVETCLLTKEEIITIAKIVENSGADFVKTSTGFSKYGARIEDIQLIKSNVKIGIKASGGIKDFQILKDMIYAGATRIGTSNGIKIIKEANSLI